MIVFVFWVAVIINLVVAVKVFTALRSLNTGMIEILEDQYLPSVTICIPVRNETDVMRECLDRVLTTRYPKLEIIVMDDSDDSGVSSLVKAYAHEGIRFVESKQLPDGWIGKNYSLHGLAEEASGELVYFMDVDSLMEHDTLLKLVSYTLGNHATMVSVIPNRADVIRPGTLLATLRYFWTLFRYKTYKAVSESNAWIIDRKYFLDAFKEDESLKSSIILDTSFAQKLSVENSYRLIMSNKWIGLKYDKPLNSQLEASIRMLYPLNNAKVSVSLLSVLLSLPVLLPYTLVFIYPLMLIPIAMQFVVFYMYTRAVWKPHAFLGALMGPILLIQEMILIVVSVVTYKLNLVTWKGRPLRVKNPSPNFK